MIFAAFSNHKTELPGVPEESFTNRKVKWNFFWDIWHFSLMTITDPPWEGMLHGSTTITFSFPGSKLQLGIRVVPGPVAQLSMTWHGNLKYKTVAQSIIDTLMDPWIISLLWLDLLNLPHPSLLIHENCCSAAKSYTLCAIQDNAPLY